MIWYYKVGYCMLCDVINKGSECEPILHLHCRNGPNNVETNHTVAWFVFSSKLTGLATAGPQKCAIVNVV